MRARAPGTSDPRRRRGPGPRRRPGRPARRRSRHRLFRRRGDPVLLSTAVLRPQADASPSAIAGRVCRMRCRVPRAAHVAVTPLLPIPPASAVLPPLRSGLHACSATAAIRRRAVPVRRHQPAAPDARHVSTARHGSLLPGGCFLWGTRGGLANALGGAWGPGWGVTPPGASRRMRLR